MKTNTEKILRVLYILSWIIFIGVCIEAGGFISNAFFTLVLSPADAKHFWQQVDLSALYNYDHGYFFAESLHIIMVAVMRSILFYMIVKFLHDKKLNMSQPFSTEVGRFIFKLSYMALFIGVLSWWGVTYTAWLVSKGVKMPDIQYLRLGGADVWLFMGVILYVIAQIFKRGIEIQEENQQTI